MLKTGSDPVPHRSCTGSDFFWSQSGQQATNDQISRGVGVNFANIAFGIGDALTFSALALPFGATSLTQALRQNLVPDINCVIPQNGVYYGASIWAGFAAGSAASGIASSASSASTTARFAVSSTGEANMSLRAGSNTLEVSTHAATRLTERGITIEAAEAVLAQKPFPYFHNGFWKTGYYDPTSRLFLSSINGQVTTVMSRVQPIYIENLMVPGR